MAQFGRGWLREGAVVDTKGTEAARNRGFFGGRDGRLLQKVERQIEVGSRGSRDDGQTGDEVRNDFGGSRRDGSDPGMTRGGMIAGDGPYVPFKNSC